MVRGATDNRSKILECALRLFVSRGFDGVGVQEIVEAAGVTKPTLYHYFGSKAGLLEALLGEGLEELHQRLLVAADYRHDLPRTLTELARAYFDFARSHGDLYRMVLSLWFAPLQSEAYRTALRLHERQFALVEKVFLAAAVDHGNTRGRQKAYAATFLGMINNYVALTLNGFTRLDDALLQQAVHQFQHGIYS